MNFKREAPVKVERATSNKANLDIYIPTFKTPLKTATVALDDE